MNDKKEYLKQVYNDTIDKCAYYKNFLNEPKTKIYNNISNSYHRKWLTTYQDAEIIIHNKDPIDVAIIMKNQKFNPLVISPADHDNPGGEVLLGSPEQEECIFRRTDYHRHLVKTIYPLKMLEVVHSPGITVLKNSNYEMMTNFITLDFLAVCPLKMAKLINNQFNEDAFSFTKNKLEQVFQIANTLEYNVIIIPAFGCGRYNNPADQIAKIFKELCGEYKKYFKKIIFAIPDTIEYNLLSSIMH